MSDQNDDKNLQLKDNRNDGAFIDFLVINPALDGRPDLQFYLHQEYWATRHRDNQMALKACVQYIKHNPQKPPITQPIYMNRKNRQLQLAF